MYETNRSLEDFLWLNEKNPAGKAVLFIALIGNEVVGMQSLVPYDFLENGKTIQTYKSEDSLVAYEYRGKGIYSQLYRMVHAYAKDKLVWGLTDKNKILTNVGMPSSERLTIAVSVQKPTFNLEKGGLQRSIAKSLFYTFLYFKSSFKATKHNSEVDLKVLSTSDYGTTLLTDFFADLTLQHPNILFPKMDKEYLDWRLTQNPNVEKNEVIYSTGSNGEIVMCSVIGYQGKSAYWQSFYTLSSVNEHEKRGHVIQLRQKVFREGRAIIHTWLFQCNPLVNSVKKLFLKSGFHAVRDGLWIVHNSSGKDLDVHKLYFSPQLGIR